METNIIIGPLTHPTSDYKYSVPLPTQRVSVPKMPQPTSPWRTPDSSVGLRLVAEFLAELQDALSELTSQLVEAGILEEEEPAVDPSST